MNQNGFTLIETIIYIALFAIIIGGGLATTLQIIEATNAAQNHVILQNEANFIFRKLDWAMTGATGIYPNDPDNNELQVAKDSTSLLFDASDNSNITLNGTGLNSSSIQISNVEFKKFQTTGEPDSITVTFTMTTNQNGKSATEDFSYTKYLRQ